MDFQVVPIATAGCNAYLVRGRRVALVDTLVPRAFGKIVKVLGEHGLSVGDVEYVLITHGHFDHVGNAARIKELSGAVLVAGAADVPLIEGSEPVPPMSDLSAVGRLLGKLPDSWTRWYQKSDPVKVDRKVRGGDSIDELGLEVVGLPGHTPGGVAFYDRDGARAFIGDMVSCFFGRCGMPALSASRSLEDIYASQEVLAGPGLDTAYPGHGRTIAPDASRAIGEFVRCGKGRA